MDIKELIKKYDITLFGKDKIRIGQVIQLRKDKAEELVRGKKTEIMTYLKEEELEKKRAFEERQAKINAIEGLHEIKRAIEEQVRWRRDFNRAMESENRCVGMRAKPKDNIDALKQKYPRAVAYLLAESESLKSNYELSAIGSEALERIINGEDYNVVLADMKKKQNDFVEKHIWN